MSKTLAIVQARMSSSRLPGKVLLDIAGQPMLLRVLARARRAQTLDGVLVATTTDPSDDPVERMCTEQGFPCHRGSLQDVLDRYYGAARQFEADVIVRLTGDCPVHGLVRWGSALPHRAPSSPAHRMASISARIMGQHGR